MEDSIPSDSSTELMNSKVPEEVGDVLGPQSVANSDDVEGAEEVITLLSLPNTDFAMVSTTFLSSHQITPLNLWILRCLRLLIVFWSLRPCGLRRS